MYVLVCMVGTVTAYSVGMTHDANNKLAMPSRISLKEFRRCPFSDVIVLMMLFIIVLKKSQAGCMCYVVVCINCLPGSLCYDEIVIKMVYVTIMMPSTTSVSIMSSLFTIVLIRY